MRTSAIVDALYPSLRPHERASVDQYLRRVEHDEATHLSWPALHRLAAEVEMPICSTDATAFMLGEALDLLEAIHDTTDAS